MMREKEKEGEKDEARERGSGRRLNMDQRQ